MIEPKLFGTCHCRICDQNFDREDMNPQDTGICLNCLELITKGVMDTKGKKYE